MTLAERLAIDLAELGNTTEKIVDTLKASGVKGCAGETDCCVLANYLTTAKSYMCIEVNYSGGVVTFSDGPYDEPEFENPALYAFLTNFDNHEYPDLEML